MVARSETFQSGDQHRPWSLGNARAIIYSTEDSIAAGFTVAIKGQKGPSNVLLEGEELRKYEAANQMVGEHHKSLGENELLAAAGLATLAKLVPLRGAVKAFLYLGSVACFLDAVRNFLVSWERNSVYKFVKGRQQLTRADIPPDTFSTFP